MSDLKFALKNSQEKIERKKKFYDMKMAKGNQNKNPIKQKKKTRKIYQFYLLDEMN